ncbi:hypothetical protein [Paraburkholderia pallida]|uniref:Uncharacterized protein n=1 Tax=Paraburkholderia pallida TaxID=2547399 RepID=A0A4P7CLA7_9BURK|nr:hypothetical protein [Paraburkholderia pallida]QBQ96458.1 hypothetical protein E1956_04270 [Paraburkholderia pallida]
MVPSSSEYIRRRVVAIIVVTGVIATVLVSSLTRNAPGLSVAQAIAGLGMITASIFFAIARDSGGYWFYAIRAGKVFDPNPVFPGDAQDRTWQGALIRNPWMAAVVGFELAALICLLAHALVPRHLIVFAWCYTIVLLPAATVGFSLLAARAGAQDALRILSGKHAFARPQHRAIQLVAADVLIAITTNFALVLPVRHKAAYSLEHGYGYPPFVVAFVILLLIVCGFMLAFAARSRRATLAGELLMGKADGQFVSLAGTPSRWLAVSRFRRYAFYLASIVVWAVLVCAAFAKWAPSLGFVPLYCVALLPLLLMYALERCAAMHRDLAEAQDAERSVLMTFSYEKLPGLIEERMT